MKVEVHPEKCVAAGLCVLTTETVFDQDPDTGTVVLLTDTPDAAARDSVREAAGICPALAITIMETGEPQ
jgi:ferredoxin